VKIALLTDTHAGARADSPVFSDYFGLFYRDVFFPELDRRGITTIVHLGDMVDRRRYLNFATWRAFKSQFFEPAMARNMVCYWAIGNHDTSYKNTNSLNASEALMYPNVRVFTEPETITIDGRAILMLPWICNENYDRSIQAIEQTPAVVCFGHLELAGFTMHKGFPPNTTGLSPALFDGFQFVGTGHYHHKSTQGHIHYLGAPYEQTWADYNDPRGFHVFDTDTLELEFIQNPNRLFYRLVYDDSREDFGYIQTFLDALRPDDSRFRDAFLKLVVKVKNNPAWYDMVTDALYKVGASDITVVDESIGEYTAAVLAEGETAAPVPSLLLDDTMGLINQYVQEVLPDSPVAPDVRDLLRSLYTDAMAQMAVAS
jgi:predicted phosphodiesterase